MASKSDVLLIEDDLCMARAIVRTLKSRGIGVRHVPAVQPARALRERFAVGVFDIDLPDGDGVGLARQLLSQRVVGRAVFHTGCLDPLRLAGAEKLGPVLAKTSGRELMAEVLEPPAGEPTAPPALLD